MKKVIIFGATGSLSAYVIDALMQQKDVHLTLFVRNSNKLDKKYTENNTVIEGDALDYESVKNAVKNQDIVCFGLSGDLKTMAESVVKAMKDTKVKRIIAISSMGIYGASWKATFRGGKDSPGIINSIMLTLMKPVFSQYRKLAEVVEKSGLDYTVLRPGRFTYVDEVDYKITYKGQPEAGRDISRKSIADFVAKLVESPDTFVNQNVGLSKNA